jgi:hypothetical protein
MARNIVTKVIEGTEYEFFQLPVLEALSLTKILVKIVGCIVSNIGSEIKNLASFGDLDLSNIGDAILSLAEKLTDEELKKLITTILKYTTISNGSGGFVEVQADVHFQGKLDIMYLVVFKGLEVNFGSFLDRIKKVAPPKVAQAEEQSKN